MPSAVFEHHARTTLRRAAAQALTAPSIHNTQPWRLHLGRETLDLELDPERCLPTVDPQHRQAIISCGCALFNARIALAAAGAAHVVERFPDGVGSKVLARIRLLENVEPEPAHDLAELDVVAASRRTNRTRYQAAPAPQDLVDRLAAAAAAEGAILTSVHHEDDRASLAAVSKWADGVQNGDPAYRAELRRWISDDPDRTDGVPASAIPHVDGHSGDEIPLRDFDTRGSGRLPARTESTRHATIVVLGTDDDGPQAWLRAGEALERVLLHLTRSGYAAGPLTQALEVPAAAAQLRHALRLTFHPQFILRIGRATPTPPTPRRPLADVLRNDDDAA